MGFLDNIKTAINNVNKGGSQFDPSCLNDEIAMKTEWTPAKGGGSNFCSHALKEISPGRMEFKATTMGIVFPSVFLVVGLVAMIAMFIVGIQKNFIMVVFGVPFGGIFFLVGFFLLRSSMTPRVFDTRIGYYWRGKKDAGQVDMRDIKENCPLKEIHAIQLMWEYCRNSSSSGGSSSYYSYEINLILKDASRINVVDHGNRSIILKDAEALSRFLDVPLWNMIQ
ncbi:hypothetical protein KAJ27_00570 [bacterium]|nr:hypothetical protein [bacterium]